MKSVLRAGDGEPVPVTIVPAAYGQWGVAVALVPGVAVRSSEVRVREEFVSSSLDVNAFRIEVYQAERR